MGLLARSRSVTREKAQLGDQLGRHLVLARVAAVDKDALELAHEPEGALAVVERLRHEASEGEAAYLAVVVAAAKLGVDAADCGQWDLAYDAFDLVHNVGELWMNRVAWDHRFFVAAFVEPFMENHGPATAEHALHVALERLRGLPSNPQRAESPRDG